MSAIPLQNPVVKMQQSLWLSNEKSLTDKVKQQALDIDWYKGKLLEQANIAEKFQEQAADLERVKLYAGADKVQEIVEAIKTIERLDSEQKRIQRSYDNRHYR